MCAYRPNVHLDVSAFLGSTHPGGWQAALGELFRMNLNHKILFGTDWPVFRYSGGHKKVMDEFLGAAGPLAGVSKPQRQWLMSRNATRLLGLDCTRQRRQCKQRLGDVTPSHARPFRVTCLTGQNPESVSPNAPRAQWAIL